MGELVGLGLVVRVPSVLHSGGEEGGVAGGVSLG